MDRQHPRNPLLTSARTRRRFLQQASAAFAAPAVGALAPRLASAAPRAQQTVELQYWTPVAATNPDYAGFQALIAEFEQENPTIKVNQQTVAFEQLENRVTVAAQGGNLPDVVWCLPETVPTYQRMGILADLTSQWNAWPDKAVIYPQALTGITYGDKILGGMPHYLGIRAYEYHTKLFDKAGVSEPPKTWDDLIAAGLKLKNAGIPGFGFCGQSVRQPQEVIVYFWQNDIDIAVPAGDGKFRNTWRDKPDELTRATEAFQLYYDLMITHGIVPRDAASWGYTELDTNLAQATIASAVDGAWMVSYEKDNPETMADMAIAAIPYKKTPATFLEVAYQVTFANSPHPDASWAWLQFIGGKQAQSSDVYKNRSVRKDIVAAGKWAKPFLDLVPQGRSWPQIALGQIGQNMIDAFQSVLLEQAKPEEAAGTLSDQVNAALAEQGQA
ncbi:MAG TPA: sugar ABC transporter substrate-binding protein [Thermomicrobiales bacterium]|nr:sugar ABC transporter substrate-binding protein [Thermomicrobiales bacterium]